MARQPGSEFGQWLDLTLKQKKISGRDLAALLGVNESIVSKWRTGTREPKPREVSKLAGILGVDQFRLIVTAGLLEPTPEIEPLPMPEEDPARKALRERLETAPGMHAELLQALMDTYDRKQQRSSSNGDVKG